MKVLFGNLAEFRRVLYCDPETVIDVTARFFADCEDPRAEAIDFLSMQASLRGLEPEPAAR
jgi:hypothetical protein